MASVCGMFTAYATAHAVAHEASGLPHDHGSLALGGAPLVIALISAGVGLVALLRMTR